MKEPAYKFDFQGRRARSEHALLRFMAESVGLKDLHRTIVWDYDRGVATVTIGTRKFRTGFSGADFDGSNDLTYCSELRPID